MADNEDVVYGVVDDDELAAVNLERLMEGRVNVIAIEGRNLGFSIAR